MKETEAAGRQRRRRRIHAALHSPGADEAPHKPTVPETARMIKAGILKAAKRAAGNLTTTSESGMEAQPLYSDVRAAGT